MRRAIPWAAAIAVLVALWPISGGAASDGPTVSRSLLMPLPWGAAADPWGMLVATVGAGVAYYLTRRRIRRRAAE